MICLCESVLYYNSSFNHIEIVIDSESFVILVILVEVSLAKHGVESSRCIQGRGSIPPL